jgi:ferrochelatase
LAKKGILLINLGSPRSTAVEDVKEYLDEFLMDEKVIDYRWIFRALLVQGIILKPDLQNQQKLIKLYGQMKDLHLL